MRKNDLNSVFGTIRKCSYSLRAQKNHYVILANMAHAPYSHDEHLAIMAHAPYSLISISDFFMF